MTPANIAASLVEENEAGYVSSIVAKARSGDTIRLKCVDSDIWTGRWRAVFSVIRRALGAGEVPDETRIGTEIKSSSVLLESVGGTEGLVAVLSILAGATTGSNLKHYEKAVLEESKKRRLAVAGKDVTQTALEAGGDVALRVMTQHKEAYEAEYAEPEDDEHPVLTFYAPSELPNPKIEWVVDGYLAKSSVTLVAGTAGAGKSHWVYGMAAALGRGNDFCGRDCVFSRTVILSEEPAGMIKEKCDRYGLADEATRVVHGPQAWTGHNWEEYLRAAAKEAERFQAEVLIIDTFAVWAKLAADDENKSGAIQAYLAPVLQIARTHQIAVVVLHHQGRSGNVRGSTAFEGTVDIALGLARFTDDDPTGRAPSPLDDDDPRRIITRLKSRMENTPPTLVVRRTRDGFDAEGTASESRGKSFSQAILDHIKEARVWVSRAELLDAKILSKHKLDAGLKQAAHTRILRVITAGPKNNLKLYGLPDMTPPDEEARKARSDAD